VAKTIVIDPLDKKSISAAIKEVKRYKTWVALKETELRQRLALVGATVASIRFSRAIYSGSKDITVRVDDTGSVAVIYAEGETVAFVEFGAGARYGYGHPLAGELGVGPGTYPEGKGNWDNPNGWYYAHGKHTFGNPPAMAMYSAVQAITEQLTTIAKEVFGS
jgi:hypothetical protein